MDFNDFKVKHKFLEVFKEKLKLKNNNYVDELLEYNVFGGKFTRAVLTFLTINQFKKEIKEEDIFVCYFNELIQAAFIIFDDIMDKSEIRRGKACWHVLKGYKVIKDAYFILSCVRKLGKYEIAKLFDIMLIRSCLGQTHDSLSEGLLEKNIGLEDLRNIYTFDNYKLICLNKNAFYTFYYPIKLGLLHCKKEELDILPVCTLLGELHQMQDDYINFLPDSNKSCLDVQQRKNTWFMCKYFENSKGIHFYDEDALEIQLKSFFDEYYKEEDNLISRIKNLNNYEINPIIEKCLMLLNKRKN